jgi:DNA-binding Lrp family transcriptional regulator
MNLQKHLDVKDLKIIKELDKNCRQSNNQIARKVGLSKEVVKYRIDRLLERDVIKRFYMLSNYFKLGINKYKLYFRIKNADKNKIEEIGKYFVDHNKTEWVVTCTGRWDFIIGFLVRNVNEFDYEIQKFMNHYYEFVHEKAVSTTLFLAHHERQLMKSKKKFTDRVHHTSRDLLEKISDLDMKILLTITNNARMPLVDIAKKLNTTSRVIGYRLKEMEKKKIILAYKAHIDPKSLGGLFCKMFVYLSNTQEKNLNDFINYASSMNGIVWPQRVMASWDFELDFELNSYDEFQDVIRTLKERFPDLIKDYEFCIVSKEFKLDFFPGCDKENH